MIHGTGRPLVKGNDITFHFTHPPILVLFYPISTHMTMCRTYFEISSSFQCQNSFLSAYSKKPSFPQEGRLPCFGQNVSTSSSTVVSCSAVNIFQIPDAVFIILFGKESVASVGTMIPYPSNTHPPPCAARTYARAGRHDDRIHAQLPLRRRCRSVWKNPLYLRFGTTRSPSCGVSPITSAPPEADNRMVAP